jgi:thiamine-phosphate pyrophosphorylase
VTPSLPFPLFAISDLRGLREAVGGWIARLDSAGVPALQWREKHLGDRDLYASCAAARKSFSGVLLINGRCDVAQAVGAQGVHLPASGLPLPPCRDHWGPDFRFGRSTHSLEEVVRARDEGADYVTFGPVYATPGKEGLGPPRGVEALHRATELGVPVVALGGVKLERFGEVAAAGAAGAAGIRLFMAEDSALVELVAEARRLFPPFPPTDPEGSRSLER